MKNKKKTCFCSICTKVNFWELISNGKRSFAGRFNLRHRSSMMAFNNSRDESEKTLRDPNLDFDISFLKIRQILTELQELEDQDAVNHETSELFHFGRYMCAWNVLNGYRDFSYSLDSRKHY